MRCKASTITLVCMQDFIERAEAVKARREAAETVGVLEEDIDKKNNQLVIIAVATVVSIFLICVCLFAVCMVKDFLRKRQDEKYNTEMKDRLPERRPPSDSPFISTIPTNQPIERSSYTSSFPDTISRSVENSTAEPSSSAASKSHGLASSIPYPGEVKSNERKLQFLKKRMASLLGPEERFSSSFSFEDEKWSKVKEALSEIELGIELSGGCFASSPAPGFMSAEHDAMCKTDEHTNKMLVIN